MSICALFCLRNLKYTADDPCVIFVYSSIVIIHIAYLPYAFTARVSFSLPASLIILAVNNLSFLIAPETPCAI